MTQRTTVVVTVLTTDEEDSVPPLRMHDSKRTDARSRKVEEELKFTVRDDDQNRAIQKTLTRLQAFIEE